jgi:hypothetical protein
MKTVHRKDAGRTAVPVVPVDEVSDETHSETTAPLQDRTLNKLVQLVKEMSPFLDVHGTVYCRIPGTGTKTSITWRLESEAVLSLVMFRSFSELQVLPTAAMMKQVACLVRGELWYFRPPAVPTDGPWTATLNAIKKSAEISGDFLGTSSDMLDRLREDVRDDTDVYSELPNSPDQLGLVLNRIGLLLRQEGIELYRPRRTETRRLWAWRSILREDPPDASATSDTSTSNVSSNSIGGSQGLGRPDDTSDRLTAQRRLYMANYRGERT